MTLSRKVLPTNISTICITQHATSLETIEAINKPELIFAAIQRDTINSKFPERHFMLNTDSATLPERQTCPKQFYWNLVWRSRKATAREKPSATFVLRKFVSRVPVTSHFQGLEKHRSLFIINSSPTRAHFSLCELLRSASRRTSKALIKLEHLSQHKNNIN